MGATRRQFVLGASAAALSLAGGGAVARGDWTHAATVSDRTDAFIRLATQIHPPGWEAPVGVGEAFDRWYGTLAGQKLQHVDFLLDLGDARREGAKTATGTVSRYWRGASDPPDFSGDLAWLVGVILPRRGRDTWYGEVLQQ